MRRQQRVWLLCMMMYLWHVSRSAAALEVAKIRRDLEHLALLFPSAPASQPHRQYMGILQEDLLQASEGDEVSETCCR